MDDFIHGRHKGRETVCEGEVFQLLWKRATGTKDDFIPGRQGALWMTSSMVAKIGTGIASGRSHYG